MSPIPTEELAFVEQAHPDGLSSRDIIGIFQQRGVKLSEATFRRYVQLGLLPRSRRVGQKGKHRGSKGVYPVSAVRRICQIRALMDAGLTQEEIRDRFVGVAQRLESFSRAVTDVKSEIEARLVDDLDLGSGERARLEEELGAVAASLASLEDRLYRLGRQVMGADLADFLPPP